MSEARGVISGENAQVSIIIPTYNESRNIIQILKSIGDNLPKNIIAEAIVVDDNSPDSTGKIVDEYLKNVKKIAGYTNGYNPQNLKKWSKFCYSQWCSTS